MDTRRLYSFVRVVDAGSITCDGVVVAIAPRRSAPSSPPTAALAAVQPDVTVESSGSVPGIAAAITNTARGGRVVMLALLPPGEQPRADGHRDRTRARAHRLLPVQRRDRRRPAGPGRRVPRRGRVVTQEYAIEDALTALHTAADPVRSGKVLLRFG